MMDDEMLERFDAAVRADAELLYCWYCGGYFPREKMGDVMCADCEAGGGPATVADMKIFEKVLAEVKKKHRRVKGIGQIVRMTLREGRR